MKKTSIAFLLLAGFITVSCDQSVAESTYRTSQTRDEMRQTTRTAARQLKSLADDFRVFFNDLREVVAEEGLMEMDASGGFISGGDSFGNVDVVDGEKAMRVNVDLPGIDKKNIYIRLKDNRMLEIKAERISEFEKEVKEGDVVYYRSERHMGSFTRTIRLPHEAGARGFKAEYKDGVLMIHIPKAKPKEQSVRDITIS